MLEKKTQNKKIDYSAKRYNLFQCIRLIIQKLPSIEESSNNFNEAGKDIIELRARNTQGLGRVFYVRKDGIVKVILIDPGHSYSKDLIQQRRKRT